MGESVFFYEYNEPFAQNMQLNIFFSNFGNIFAFYKLKMDIISNLVAEALFRVSKLLFNGF